MISADNVPYELNLIVMQWIRIRVLKLWCKLNNLLHIYLFILNFNISSLCGISAASVMIRWTVSACIWPWSLWVIWELQGKILSCVVDDRFGSTFNDWEWNGKQWAYVEVFRMFCMNRTNPYSGSCWSRFAGKSEWGQHVTASYFHLFRLINRCL